jgi:hypothetical protein
VINSALNSSNPNYMQNVSHAVQLPSILSPVTSCCKVSPEAKRSIELVFC